MKLRHGDIVMVGNSCLIFEIVGSRGKTYSVRVVKNNLKENKWMQKELKVGYTFRLKKSYISTMFNKMEARSIGKDLQLVEAIYG